MIDGRLGKLTVAADVTGARIDVVDTGGTNGTIGSIFIGGSLVGTTTPSSGSIFGAHGIGRVTIGQDIQAGSGGFSGLTSTGKIGSLTLGGSLMGGPGEFSGRINAVEAMGKVTIGQDVVGGSGFGSAMGSGNIGTGGDLSGVVIGGSLMGGVGDSDLAIGSITIHGRVEYADILAGYDAQRMPTTGDAQIGAVRVDDDWVSSNLVAGIQNPSSMNRAFGTASDSVVNAPNDDPDQFSRIASVTIGGHVTGTDLANDHFGFAAQQIGTFKIAGLLIPHDDEFHNLATENTNDVAIHQV